MQGRAGTVVSICLSAALGATLPGCAAAPASPDTEYRQALEKALIAGQCTGLAVNRMWAAHDRWLAVASAISGYLKTDEAAALLRQGDSFQLIACPEVARASYDAVLQKFPEPEYAAFRSDAWMGLQRLPPPVDAPQTVSPPLTVKSSV